MTSQFVSDHVSNLLPLHGELPEDKERMIQLIVDTLQRLTADHRLAEEMETRRHLINL